MIVPTHRGAHRLPELLEAFMAQDYDGEWELVVVVDGVLDSSLDIIDSFNACLPLNPVILEKQSGVVAALNAGIEAAKGRIFIRCDDDLTPVPSFLSLHMRHHEGLVPVGVIGPTRDVFPDSAYARAYGIPANKQSLAAAYARHASFTWVGWAANVSAPCSVLKDLGGYDAKFVYGQDSELGYRIAQTGVEILVDAELETLHRGPSTSAGTRIPRAFVSGASKRLFNSVHPEAGAPAPAPAGFKGQIWNGAVRLIAGVVRTREGFIRVGQAVDGVVERLPLSLATKVISLFVEAAGISGRAHGNLDLSSYKGQKAVEIAGELTRSRRA
ncbi:GT2 family glycosyltransferase [Arthrobacter sp. UYEF6]